MRFGGKIEELNQIIVSDPSYGSDVTCRYERKNINQKDMNVLIEIHDYSEKVDKIQINGVEFHILIYSSKSPYFLKEDGSFSHSARDKITEFEIGIDTSCVAFGINDFADNIRKAQNEWHPPFALNTLSDGVFGEVKDGIEDSKIDFIFISGFLDEDTQYSIDDVLEYITKYLEVKNLYKEINGIKFPIINNDKDITDDMF